MTLIVSITKLKILLSIIVHILNSSMFSLDPLPRRSNSKPKVNWLFHAAKVLLQKDTTRPKRRKNAKKMTFVANLPFFLLILLVSFFVRANQYIMKKDTTLINRPLLISFEVMQFRIQKRRAGARLEGTVRKCRMVAI